MDADINEPIVGSALGDTVTGILTPSRPPGVGEEGALTLH